jgi:glycosyltransferase involved in cell wall biosynthesis
MEQLKSLPVEDASELRAPPRARAKTAVAARPLRVALVYRAPRPGGYSIEGLFRTIAGALPRDVSVIEYVAGPRSRAFADARALRALKCDVYHVTGDVNYLALLLPGSRTVLTVHDLGHLLNDLTGVRKAVYRLFWFAWPIRHVRAVTAISEETRARLEHHIGSAKRFEVIPNCYGAQFRRGGDGPPVGGKPRILQVGTRPHKNLDRVIEALAGLECRLVVVGPISEAQRARLDALRIEFESHVDIAADELVALYNAADVVCFASTHEGFGLPIIEAQAVGVPVVTSALKPMCDVAGDSARLVDPHDVESIREGIADVLARREYRDELVARGELNARRYSPDAVAARYAALYRRIVDATGEGS